MPNRPPARRVPMTERERRVYDYLWKNRDNYGIDHRVHAHQARLPVRTFYNAVERIKAKGYKLPSGIPGNMLHRGPKPEINKTASKEREVYAKLVKVPFPARTMARIKKVTDRDRAAYKHGMKEALAKAGLDDPIMSAFVKMFGPPMKIRPTRINPTDQAVHDLVSHVSKVLEEVSKMVDILEAMHSRS